MKGKKTLKRSREVRSEAEGRRDDEKKISLLFSSLLFFSAWATPPTPCDQHLEAREST